jgi:hypothetical protein
MVRLLLLALLCSVSGCFAVSARAHVDVVSDVQHHGVMAGVNVGFGYAGEHSAVLANLGVDSIQPALGLHGSFDYVSLSDHPWRAGYGGTAGIIGEPSIAGARFAALFPLRDRSSSEYHEKSGGGTSRTLWAASLEGTLGAVGNDRGGEVHLGGAAGVGLELYSVTRVWF